MCVFVGKCAFACVWFCVCVCVAGLQNIMWWGVLAFPNNGVCV